MEPAIRAQMAMMLEVTAYPKPGNVDRCHDYPSTHLEHFLASAILAGPTLHRAQEGGVAIGELFREAIAATNVHSGGNTHFGAFILLIPLVVGRDIGGAARLVRATTVQDAVDFYESFDLTSVRMHKTDPLDVHNPRATEIIRERGLSLFDIMVHSAPTDMVAREWTDSFRLTRKGADLLKQHGSGRKAIVATFLEMLASEPDTFVIKKHGREVALEVMSLAQEAKAGKITLEMLDQRLVSKGINPGSLADILIASIYVALGEGWEWDS
ncbi:MAG: triphosphoribosyl-dephospho-CoA synthase [Methanomicrobiales archaeon]|nr:triphosphoribosyl-dephospho-CoA synthase [Methanomicrobiales archaeon]